MSKQTVATSEKGTDTVRGDWKLKNLLFLQEKKKKIEQVNKALAFFQK